MPKAARPKLMKRAKLNFGQRRMKRKTRKMGKH